MVGVVQVAPCYVFLASADGSYFSGQVGMPCHSLLRNALLLTSKQTFSE